jgi:membrane associated rhomboid family serine protease
MMEMHESNRPQLPEDVVEFLHAFYGATPRLVVTPLLVGVNVAVFLAMVLSGAHPLMPSAETLLRWGANYGTALNEGESWRLLTSMFVHVGVIHVAVNMYALWASGSVLERLTGNYGFLLLSVLSGLVGSLNSTLWHMESFRVSAGASGAVFGVFGGLLGFLIPQRSFVPGIIYRRLLRVVGFVVVGNLVFGALVSFIDNAAHLGGFLSGLLLGRGPGGGNGPGVADADTAATGDRASGPARVPGRAGRDGRVDCRGPGRVPRLLGARDDLHAHARVRGSGG